MESQKPNENQALKDLLNQEERKEIEIIILQWEKKVPKNGTIRNCGNLDGNQVILTKTITKEDPFYSKTFHCNCQVKKTDVLNAIKCIEKKANEHNYNNEESNFNLS